MVFSRRYETTTIRKTFKSSSLNSQTHRTQHKTQEFITNLKPYPLKLNIYLHIKSSGALPLLTIKSGNIKEVVGIDEVVTVDQ